MNCTYTKGSFLKNFFSTFGGFTDLFVISINPAPTKEQDMNCPATFCYVCVYAYAHMWGALLWSQLGEDGWWFARSEGDSKVSLYQTVVIDSSVCNLNQALFCKVQIHDAPLQ